MSLHLVIGIVAIFLAGFLAGFATCIVVMMTPPKGLLK